MAVPDTSALPRHAILLGLAIFGSAALPVIGDHSFLDWLRLIADDDPAAALMVAATFGSPFLFGLAVALAGLLRGRPLAAALLKAPLVLVHTSLVLAALLALGARDLPLRLPFVGFALVSGLAFIVAHAEAEAADRPLGPRWLARWGGVVLAGTCAWLLGQTLDGEPLGRAVHVHLVAAALLAVSLPRDPPRRPDPDQ